MIVQLFTYLLTADQTGTVWSTSTHLSAFAGDLSSSVITRVVTHFFDDVRTIIQDARTAIKNDHTALVTAIQTLQASLATYQTTVNSGVSRQVL